VRTWQWRGGGFPAPYSSPLVPPLTDGQQRGTLFSCQLAFPATLSRSVTDEPRNSKNVLGVARRVPTLRLNEPPPNVDLRWLLSGGHSALGRGFEGRGA
jgi:hypothetical protein